MFGTGKKYKTVGGWEAIVIWVETQGFPCGLYAIHKPNTDKESLPIRHDYETGKAMVTFAINEPPTYEASHPADLTTEEVKHDGN
ncbi:MAG: hypothetical protein PHN44_00570 [Candidatus Marinimicrobia bacterium]|nr:hypothetical protein [Candidatus Neomarinimicrobiota bacterium]MDD5539141.1 hypothetical protein [Candidatus Neomarinimicrobiota bacterium]